MVVLGGITVNTVKMVHFCGFVVLNLASKNINKFQPILSIPQQIQQETQPTNQPTKKTWILDAPIGPANLSLYCFLGNFFGWAAAGAGQLRRFRSDQILKKMTCNSWNPNLVLFKSSLWFKK